jgi:simple sugar transport system substrate-binding protein
MKKIINFFLTLSGILLLGSGVFAADLKVGFVYVGPPGDFGWTYQHDQGRKAVEKAFGDRVETTFAENVPEGADAERVMTQMALSGHDMIFATSFGYNGSSDECCFKISKCEI